MVSEVAVIDATLVTIHGFWSSPATWEKLNEARRADEELRGLRIHPFGYPSPKKPRLPVSATRVPDYDDIAQAFSTEYATVLAGASDIAVVTHSQGGLILQRFLAWMVSEGRARELSRIRSVVMLACPNGGSEYLESLRRTLGYGRHPQAGRLHVLDRQVADTQRTVLQRIVNASAVDDYQCRIPFHVYAGGSDDIVRPASAQAAFPGASTIAGNHFTILDPAAPGNRTAEAVKRHMLADIAAPRALSGTGPASAGPAPEGTGEREPPAAGNRPGSAKYVVNAHGVQGLQIGDHNVQHNVFPADYAAPPAVRAEAAGRVDAVILTALEEEHAAVVRALGDGDVRRWRGRRLYAARVGSLEVLAFPMGGMGNPGSAQAATLVISVWNPAYIILAGIAGGIRRPGDDLRLGDVLVPDRIVGYEPAKIRPEGAEPRYEVLQPHWELLQTARGLDPRDWALGITATRPDGYGGRVVPRAFFGPVFSGEKVLADGATLAGLREHWGKAIGVEMEGLGVAVASYRGGPGFLMAKAVSDFADAAKDDDWHGYAAESAARFAVAVLKNVPVQPEPERPQAVPALVPRQFPGPVKIQFCRRLGDSWEELADLFEIAPHERARFRPGNEPRDLWQWLEVRDKLPVVLEGLAQIGRDDLAAVMRAAMR